MSTINDYLNKTPKQALPADDAKVILGAIAKASIEIASNVSRAGLLNILGSAGAENVQGEEQQKLDVLADNIVTEALRKCKLVAAIASEEHETIVSFGDDHKGQYVVAFDPLDGSSNIDVNVSIGTIFTVFKRTDTSNPPSENDFLRQGIDQEIAGYVIYGPSTMMVFTIGAGLQGFTLDPKSGEYHLSNPDITTPVKGKIYSINEGNSDSFPKEVAAYLNYCKSKDNDAGSPYSSRYIGSMVADFHRNLLKGGIFIYPATAKAPHGKLRLLYECMPMAYIMEEAGGMANTGKERIMNLKLEKLHQRTPIIVGSESMVEKYLSFSTKKEPA